MSLLEKLSQKRTEKKQAEENTVIQAKKQSFEQISNQLTATQEKKQRIINLSKSLRENYKTGAENLESFKEQKKELKDAFEENEDILKEDGIENFEEMLEANADEPEVKKLRKTGGRGPAKRPPTEEEGRMQGVKITTDAAGDTGKLYKQVETIQQISASLREEMGIAEKDKKNLNFSATKITEGENKGMSNREANFIQIEEYLKTLDTDIEKLEKQKKEAYLETPGGVQDALYKINNPEWILRDKTFDDSDRFEVKIEVLELLKKTGPEPIKQIYFEALNNRLKEVVQDKKNKGSYQNEEQIKKYWESQKKAEAQISEISRGAIDKRFSEAWERYFTDQNKEILQNIDSENKLKDSLEKAISYLKNHINLQDPELAERKIKIKAGFWGSEIYEADSEYRPIGNATDAARAKRDQYANKHIEELEIETNKLRLASIVLGRKDKIEKINKKINIFKDFKNDRPLKESDIIALGINPKEITEMKEIRQEKDIADKNYRRYDDNRMRFFGAIDKHKIELPITDKDVLNDQEMSFAELPERLKMRRDEIVAYLNDLPEPEKSILAERDRAQQEAEQNEKKFKEIINKNIDVIRSSR